MKWYHGRSASPLADPGGGGGGGGCLHGGGGPLEVPRLMTVAALVAACSPWKKPFCRQQPAPLGTLPAGTWHWPATSAVNSVAAWHLEFAAHCAAHSATPLARLAAPRG